MLRFLRALGYIWLSPLTLVGLGAALIGSRLYEVEPDWTFHWIAGPSGPWAWWMRRRNFGAMTLGASTVYRDEGQFSLAVLRRHEKTHVQQGLVLGFLFHPLAYGVGILVSLARGKGDYWGNPLEEQAYRSAQVGRPLWPWE